VTKDQALILAATDDDYRARCMRGEWVVWSDAADHVVEFDGDIDAHVRGALAYLASFEDAR